MTAEFIGQFKVDYAIIGSAAVDPDGSLLDYDFREVRVAQAIIKNARKSYLVADHTKFKMAAPVRIASLAALDGFFTDIPPPNRSSSSAPTTTSSSAPWKPPPGALTGRRAPQ